MIIPEEIKKYFWSYNISTLDFERDAQRIIINIINYGSWKSWQWLLQYYGEKRVTHLINKIPITEFRPSARRLIALLLNIHEFNTTPRGADSSRAKSIL